MKRQRHIKTQKETKRGKRREGETNETIKDIKRQKKT